MQPRNLHNAVLIVFVLATVTCHGAGWSGVWPAQEHPRETVRQLAECHTAIVERVTATSTAWSEIAPQTWYRSNRANLINIKTYLLWTLEPRIYDPYRLGHSGYWLTWCVTNGLETTASAAAVLNAAGTNQFPHYGNLGVLVGGGQNGSVELFQKLHMPTNYLLYTPYRCLNGLGPFTNDTSTAYPHGYTNAETASGGTNYPAGRTCWYTTDYGWADLPRVFAELTITLEQGVQTFNPTNANFFGATQGTNHQPWATVQGIVETNYCDRPDSGPLGWYSDGIYTYGLGYANGSAWSFYAKATGGEWYHSAWGSGWNTQGVNVAEYYAYSKAFTPASGLPAWTGEANAVFADAGTGLVETNYAFVVNNSTPYSNGVSGVWGDTAFPSWCPQPTLPVDPSYLYGFESLGFYVVTGPRYYGDSSATNRPTGIRRWTFTFH
jgi:hypothetical protein